MKKILCFLFAVSILSGCGDDYDDSALTGRVDDLENRVTKLEELCKQMNTNISSLQALVNALQDNDYITGVTPITKDGETIGYTISFAKRAPITIYHGEDGKDGQDGKPGEDGNDGSTPIIGVKQDPDGVYYWTLNGDWLTDDSGNKIQAEGRDGTDGKPGEDGNDGQDGKPGEDGNDGQDGQDGKPGEDGKDGITPQLKIEDGDWYVSYNDGASWTQLGKATGDKGEPGEPGQAGGIFKDVEETDDSVIFTLNDDSTITIPKATASETLDIVFGNTDSINVLPDKTYEIEYTITGADENTLIEVVAQDLYKASVSPTDYQSGKIIVTTPSADLGASRVLVFVSKGTNTIMRILNFVESVILVSTNTVEIAAEGETVQVEVETNVTYSVEIPEADRAWLSIVETRAATHKETLTFTAQANPNTTYRYSTVNLKDDSGLIAQSILFAQKASGYKTVHVETAGTLENHISTDEVYGDLPIEGDGSFSEDSPLRPSSPYSASKAAADQLALAFMRTYGLEVTVSRCCNCFGPHQHQEKFIPTIIASALSGHPVPIYGSGLNVREWITSADHARAILAILDRGRPGEIYNTGSGVRLSNIELAGMLLSILGRDRSLIRHTEDRKGHDRRYSISSEKIRQELGFVPQDSFILSLEKTVAWYAARGLPSSSPDVL